MSPIQSIEVKRTGCGARLYIVITREDGSTDDSNYVTHSVQFKSREPLTLDKTNGFCGEPVVNVVTVG